MAYKTNSYGVGYRLEAHDGRILLVQIYISPRTGKLTISDVGMYDDARAARTRAVRDQRGFETVTGQEPAECIVDETWLGVHGEVES